jgi:hypothetical protein
MFAGSVQSSIFHLVNVDRKNTVCGLRVSGHVSYERRAGRLHLLKARPTDCRVCKHCTRLINESESVSAPDSNHLSNQML